MNGSGRQLVLSPVSLLPSLQLCQVCASDNDRGKDLEVEVFLILGMGGGMPGDYLFHRDGLKTD